MAVANAQFGGYGGFQGFGSGVYMPQPVALQRDPRANTGKQTIMKCPDKKPPYVQLQNYYQSNPGVKIINTLTTHPYELRHVNTHCRKNPDGNQSEYTR